jgi:hypothetical protein
VPAEDGINATARVPVLFAAIVEPGIEVILNCAAFVPEIVTEFK